jgi:formamidopyrimidine-DNA glycosylase
MDGLAKTARRQAGEVRSSMNSRGAAILGVGALPTGAIDNARVPELPEVEATRLSFASQIRAAHVRAVRLGRALRWPLGIEPAQLVGLCVGEVLRRGKYLWLPLRPVPDDRGDGAGGLLLHLGMSGALRFATGLGPPGPHDHFDLETSHGMLRLTDPRRFGAVVWSAGPDRDLAGKLLAGLGVEPFSDSFTAEVLHQGLRGRRVSVKQALLAGDVVVGVGNIYCSEALFQAGIDPRTPAYRVSLPRCRRLAQAVRDTLTRALEAGGSTLRNFSNAEGMGGRFQEHARVYGREGLPCLVCTTPVRRIVQGQRATYLCPGCQRR